MYITSKFLCAFFVSFYQFKHKNKQQRNIAFAYNKLRERVKQFFFNTNIYILAVKIASLHICPYDLTAKSAIHNTNTHINTYTNGKKPTMKHNHNLTKKKFCFLFSSVFWFQQLTSTASAITNSNLLLHAEKQPSWRNNNCTINRKEIIENKLIHEFHNRNSMIKLDSKIVLETEAHKT